MMWHPARSHCTRGHDSEGLTSSLGDVISSWRKQTIDPTSLRLMQPLPSERSNHEGHFI